MGAGKTSVAKKLAERLHKELVSMDDLIENREGTTISQIFSQKGEPYFRKVERDIVEELSQKGDLIIDCGGGIVIQQDNINNLKRNGRIVYLKTSPEVIYERVKAETHRPLLQVKDPKARIEELLKIREPYYNQANIIVNTDAKTVDEVVDEICKKLEANE